MKALSLVMKTCLIACACLVVGVASVAKAKSLRHIEDILSPQVYLEDLVADVPGEFTFASSDSGHALSGVLQEESQSVSIYLRPLDGHWDIANYAFYRIDLRNSGSDLVWIEGRLDNVGAEDWHNSTASMAYVLPGETATLGFAFPRAKELNDAPSVFDLQYSKPNGQRQHWKHFDPGKVVGCRLVLRSSGSAISLEDIRIGLAQAYGAEANADLLQLPYLDAFGQVRNLDWRGKLKAESELRLRQQQEQLGDFPEAFNRYGGWRDGPTLDATGYFRVAKYKGRWWFVDPDGKLFFSHGINSVGFFGQRTPIAGREAFFEWLPEEGEMAGVVRSGRAHFLVANLKRTFGGSWREAAYDRVFDRMRSWGMNTVGAWSDRALKKYRRMPYTAILHIGHHHSPLGVQISDPFSAEFKESLRKGLNRLLVNGKPDPWCLGVFIDNEIYWSQRFVRNAIEKGASQPAQQAVLRWLKEEYSSVDRLNHAWGTSYDSWEVLNSLPEAGSLAFESDLSAMRSLIADAYYRACKEAVREVLPGQLYLGSRIHKAPAEVMAAAIQHTDVLSLNLYEPLASLKLPEGIDKPCLISEFHFGAPDRGVPGPGLWPVGDQLQRSRAYAAYVMDGVLSPNVVGTHWFAFSDQSAAGRPGGENFQVGFVDVTDTPYPEITTVSRAIAEWMYPTAEQSSLSLLHEIEKSLNRSSKSVIQE